MRTSLSKIEFGVGTKTGYGSYAIADGLLGGNNNDLIIFIHKFHNFILLNRRVWEN